MCVCIVCPAPLWVGGACLYVHACIGVCMYLSVSMYVRMYSLCVCMYTCNACCEASTQTNLLLLSLLLGGPNPFGGGGGGHEPGARDHIYIIYLDLQTIFLTSEAKTSRSPKRAGFSSANEAQIRTKRPKYAQTSANVKGGEQLCQNARSFAKRAQNKTRRKTCASLKI